MAQPTPISGPKKAAILVCLLGEEAASSVYKNLSDADVERLTQEISELKAVNAQIALHVLEDYQKLALTQDYLAQGGSEFAKRLLVKAFGEAGAQTLLEQVSRSQEMSAGKLDSLQKSDPQQLARFLEGEHPQTIALILAHLDSKQACTLLMRLPESVRAEAVTRLAQLRQFSPDVAQKVSLVLHNRLQSLGEQSRRAYAGLKSVADMLNRLEPNAAKSILEVIEKQDAKVAVSIRNLMFTFEDFLAVQENGIRDLLAHLDKKTLAMALKGASEDMRAHIFKCMSSRAVEMLKEDMEVLGPVRSKEVSKAQQEVVATARKMESEGKLTLKADGDEEYMV
ncbi:MAG TPA: flagellar motor switch protein FliG [Terriglobales bacterium]|nr:flagellar motor switch protein FliG [Terriglobales bacterium]